MKHHISIHRNMSKPGKGSLHSWFNSDAERRYPDLFEDNALVVCVGMRTSHEDTYLFLSSKGLYVGRREHNQDDMEMEGPWKVDYALMKGIMEFIETIPSAENSPENRWSPEPMLASLERISSGIDAFSQFKKIADDANAHEEKVSDIKKRLHDLVDEL